MNKFRNTLLRLSACALFSGCATQSPNLAYERQLDARLQTAEALDIDPDDVVCRTTDVSGSRIKKVVCGSRDAITEQARANQDAFRNVVNDRKAQSLSF